MCDRLEFDLRQKAKIVNERRSEGEMLCLIFNRQVETWSQLRHGKCGARLPTLTFASNAVRALQRRISVAPRKRPLATAHSLRAKSCRPPQLVLERQAIYLPPCFGIS